MDAGRRAECVASEYRVIVGNRFAGRFGDGAYELVEFGQVAIDPPHEHEVDEEHVHRRVPHTLANPQDRSMNARCTGLERGEAVDRPHVAIAVPVPVDTNASAELVNELLGECHDSTCTRRRGMTNCVSDADA